MAQLITFYGDKRTLCEDCLRYKVLLDEWEAVIGKGSPACKHSPKMTIRECAMGTERHHSCCAFIPLNANVRRVKFGDTTGVILGSRKNRNFRPGAREETDEDYAKAWNTVDAYVDFDEDEANIYNLVPFEKEKPYERMKHGNKKKHRKNKPLPRKEPEPEPEIQIYMNGGIGYAKQANLL